MTAQLVMPAYQISPSGDPLPATGPFGELLPPPLLEGRSEEDVLQELLQVAPGLAPLLEQGEGRVQALELAMTYCHGIRLREALRGEAISPSGAETLLRNEVLRGVSLSLRPLGREAIQPASFAPLLTLIGIYPRRWRLGLDGMGPTVVFDQEDPGLALDAAQNWYRECMDVEETRRRA